LPAQSGYSIRIINNKFYALCLDKGLYVSSDAGNSFTPINNGLPLGNDTWYREILEKNGILFTVSTNYGVYYSLNNGISWNSANANISGMKTYGQIGMDNNYLYCIAYKFDNSLPDYVQLYKRPLSDFSVGITNIFTEAPAKFTLSQNYPNPFNPVTKILFSIPKNEFVTLKVYDILGNEAAQLVNSSLNAGTYEYSFDGSSLSSGIYFYKITTENFTDTKRMSLIK